MAQPQDTFTKVQTYVSMIQPLLVIGEANVINTYQFR